MNTDLDNADRWHTGPRQALLLALMVLTPVVSMGVILLFIRLLGGFVGFVAAAAVLHLSLTTVLLYILRPGRFRDVPTTSLCRPLRLRIFMSFVYFFGALALHIYWLAALFAVMIGLLLILPRRRQ